MTTSSCAGAAAGRGASLGSFGAVADRAWDGIEELAGRAKELRHGVWEVEVGPDWLASARVAVMRRSGWGLSSLRDWGLGGWED
jgi:hypothetical protein